MSEALLLPELGNRRQGKVRDIYELEDRLVLVASDRISIFDRILNETIFEKGRILTQLAYFWFEQTKDILPNHVLSHPDPNVMVVKKCAPIPIEVIVRGYMTGSLWRDYAQGKREKCGVQLVEGLQEHDPLPHPIVTPTTKSDEHDEDISKEEIVQQHLVTADQWKTIEEKAVALYQRGCELLQKRGMILVDTKYEFGWDDNGQLTLIDEIHTPDSSRFWFQKDVAKKEVRFPDKEFVREWGRSQGFTGEGTVPSLDQMLQEKIHRGYREVYEAITGDILTQHPSYFPKRMLANLKKERLIQGSFVLILMGSEKDRGYADKMIPVLEEAKIPYRIDVASAHKQTKDLLKILDTFNQSLEPVVCLTLVGRSNALSGVVACNCKWPVIACPVFSDRDDYMINIHSSLQMPSNAPVMTTIDPHNAALAAVRILKTMESTH